ncbi:AAA family ATPase [Peribacillus sp. FSL E2-0159]|uniref:AAA family ATPase n=1 Tax=Peribacillus sp. FSL E2-0159 TaxID=2975289 RepID=UPI00315AC577
MNRYIIKKIYIKNFKSIDEAMIELEGDNLNVLDGPNGFGKTTIYDAVQLILTGKIRRIESNKIVTTNRGFSDHLFSKDQTKPTIIKVEFLKIDEPEKRLVLARVLTPTTLTSMQKRPQDFSHFQLYKLINIEEDHFQERLTDKQLNELFGLEDIEERYNLYHYIEQEESSYLFKQNEKDRMGVISKLFNIEAEMNQKIFLEKAKNKIIKAKTKLEGQIRKLESEFKQENQSSIEVQPYKPLIDLENVLNIPWDQENIKPLDHKLKEEYLDEVDEIKNLILNSIDFQKELKNEKINGISQNENKLKAFIVLGYFYKQYDELEKQYQNQIKFVQILDILKNKEIIHKTIDLDFIFERIELPFEKENINQRINLIKTYNVNSNAISNIVNQMNLTRGKLLKDYERFIENNPEKQSECPFCGDTKNSYEELIDQINHRTEELKQNFDASAKTVNDELEKLFNEYLNHIAQKIEGELSLQSLDKDFFEQLKTYKNVITDMIKATEWFLELDINIDLYINKDKKYIEDLDQKVLELKSDIEKKRSKVNDFCREHMNSFKRIYRDRFNQNDQLIAKISETSIEEKKNYIENQYFLQSSLSFQKVQQLKIQQSKIEESVQSLGRIIAVYNKKINKHRGKMISDIEIPFYVYSGKIIQYHQRGIGVFIKEDKDTNQSGETQLKSINFVPPQKTDHDIVHSFSSGQLSSTVIAFTLALNKVYGNRGIMTLLIDDPIQTMDEMNMASFVELLRNEFNDRQLILSTHEDNISLFIRYKFLKYGLSVGKINVKQKLYTR